MHIRIHNLTRSFGSLRANDQISLEFAAGQIHGILGENGAGKSTLMKVLSGFLRRDSGEILLDGTPVRLHSPADALRVGIGMVHQDPLDVPAFTALENFYCASPRAALPDRRQARRVLHDLAEQLDFAVEADAPIARLTVGQRQQLEIMRLLACGVQVLILDEPTTGITTTQAAALFVALRRLADQGKTVLFVSHKLNEVAEVCHTVSVLRAGRVAGEGQMSVPQPRENLLQLMFGHTLRMIQTTAPAPPPPTADTAAVWQLEEVTLRERNRMLAHLSLTIRAGQVIGLAGLEGSGQQLLLRLLAGQLPPVAGKLRLQGMDVTRAATTVFQDRGVQYLPADRLAEGLVGPLSLAEHMVLTMPAAGLVVNAASARSAARTAITDYEIKATPDVPMLALSGGNQQRAMLALLPERCAGLLMENPSRGLDIASARAIWQRLLARRQAGTALVFASTDLDELLNYSDDVIVFYSGQVSAPLPSRTLTATRLAELIGGVGFEATHD